MTELRFIQPPGRKSTYLAVYDTASNLTTVLARLSVPVAEFVDRLNVALMPDCRIVIDKEPMP